VLEPSLSSSIDAPLWHGLDADRYMGPFTATTSSLVLVVGKPLRSGDTSSSTQAPWILGKKVMLPAGVIQRIDGEAEKVYVHRTKDQIKNAPEYDDTMASDEGYRGELGSYYGSSGPGYRDWDQSL
jgi:hypothetical protein